jgi:hypothetical protein
VPYCAEARLRDAFRDFLRVLTDPSGTAF